VPICRDIGRVNDIFIIMLTKKDDIYIKVLEYGNEHKDGFTLEELIKDLGLNGKKERLVRESVLNRGNIFHEVGAMEGIAAKSYMLSFEDKFKLLEYVELREARRNSIIATILAIIAIMISVLT